MNIRTAERRKFALMEALEQARLKRMAARDAADAAFEAAHELEGELKCPRPPANRRSGDYVRDRVLEKRAGAKKGWRRRAPLEAAYEKGQLACGSKNHNALERFEAGQRYARLFRAAEKTGSRDSTDLEKVNGGAGAGDLPPGQMRALKMLAAIEARLSDNDRRIVRSVCGFEVRPNVVICAISAMYKDRVSARLCEALDALMGAGRG